MAKSKTTKKKIGAPKGNKRAAKISETGNKKWTPKKAAAAILKYTKESEIPYVEECAEKILDINDDTLNEWTKEYTAVSAAIKRLKRKQKLQLQRDGLHNRVNTGMAIFLLKANHNLRESQHIDHTSDGDKINGIDLQVVNDERKA